MERKLASVRIVKEINFIESADNIVRVTVDGWNCITQKNNFKVGDLCVYFEIDSFLPIKPEFEFLRKSSYKAMNGKEGFRLKTIKLKNTLSQGLVLPISILPQQKSYKAGDDVSEILGVTKYEPPIPAQLTGVIKRYLPFFLNKTDQERIQNIYDDISSRDEQFEVTLKLDGCSATYYLNNNEFGVCSRNVEILQSDTNTYWSVAEEYHIERMLRRLVLDSNLNCRNIAIQGEIIGEGIQGNPEKIKGHQFYLFDIWNIDKLEYYKPTERNMLYNKYFSALNHVPIIDHYRHLNYFDSIDQMLKDADGKSLYNDIREGLVYKSHTSSLTFKVISNEFLLKK